MVVAGAAGGYHGGMCLLPALCLLAVLALAPGAVLGDAGQARDRVVAEGTEGLSAEEVYERARALARVGDHRALALYRTAAEMGHGVAAARLAMEAFRDRGAGWAAETFGYARIAADTRVGDFVSFFLLAESGRALDPPRGAAQIDLWYRIAILAQTRLSALNRQELRRSFELLRMEVLGGGPFPARYAQLLGELVALRDAGAGAFLEAAGPVCAAGLEDAERLCLLYRAEAAKRGDPDSQYRVAIDLLDKGMRIDSAETDMEFAAHLLCEAAVQGDAAALERLALLIVRDEARPALRLDALAFALRDTEALPPELAQELYDGVVAKFTESDRMFFDFYAERGVPPPGC